MDEFRKEMIRKLVGVAHRVRRAAIFVDARRSANAYDEAMSEIIDATFDLRLIRHEIDSNPGPGPMAPNRAFEEWDEIKRSVGDMEHYLNALIDEYRDAYQGISKLRVEADQNRELQATIWEKIARLPQLKGMIDYLGGQGAASKSAFERDFLDPYQSALLLMRNQMMRVRA